MTLESAPTTLPKRPNPPAGMSLPARNAWAAILADYPVKHFTSANLILLEQLCRARALVDQCDRRISKRGLLIKGKVNPLVQVRAQAWSEVRACATKLRLAISGTMRAEKAAARPDENAGLRKPWERSA
jgi:phage terminase small subunit